MVLNPLKQLSQPLVSKLRPLLFRKKYGLLLTLFYLWIETISKMEAIITHQLRRHGRVTHSLLAPPSTRIGKIELNTSAPWGQNQMLINLSPYLLFLGFTPVCTGESQQKSLLPDYEPAAATRLQLQCQLPLVAVRHIFWSGTTLK